MLAVRLGGQVRRIEQEIAGEDTGNVDLRVDPGERRGDLPVRRVDIHDLGLDLPCAPRRPDPRQSDQKHKTAETKDEDWPSPRPHDAALSTYSHSFTPPPLLEVWIAKSGQTSLESDDRRVHRP